MTRDAWDNVGGIPPYLPLPVTEAHYRALGHAIAMWSSVENQTQHLLWAVLGLEQDRGKILTAALRYDTHLEIMNVVTPTSSLSQAQRFEVSDIIAESKRLKKCRDRIAHSAWAPGEDLLNPVTHQLRMKDKSSGQIYTPLDIERIALEINSLLRRMLRLSLDLLYP